MGLFLAKAAASRLKKPLPLNLRKIAGLNASDHEDSTQDSVLDATNNVSTQHRACQKEVAFGCIWLNVVYSHFHNLWS